LLFEAPVQVTQVESQDLHEFEFESPYLPSEHFETHTDPSKKVPVLHDEH